MYITLHFKLLNSEGTIQHEYHLAGWILAIRNLSLSESLIFKTLFMMEPQEDVHPSYFYHFSSELHWFRGTKS